MMPAPARDFHACLAAHRELFARLEPLAAATAAAAQAITASLARGGKLMLCGNGGSAADSQHLAAEMTGRFLRERRPLAAVALTTDSSALTCIGNDYGFDHVFERQLRALARPGDCLVGLSTSGQSRNVIEAFIAAREMGVRTIGLLGRDGGALAALADLAIVVPGDATAHIQEAHIFLGHVLCGLVEDALADPAVQATHDAVPVPVPAAAPACALRAPALR